MKPLTQAEGSSHHFEVSTMKSLREIMQEPLRGSAHSRLFCFWAYRLWAVLPAVALVACAPQARHAVEFRPADTLPLESAAIHQLGAGSGVSTMGWLLRQDGDRVDLVYDRIAEDGSQGRIMLVASADGGRTFSEPTQLDFGAEAVQGSVSAVRTTRGAHVYFLKSEGVSAPAKYFRSRFEGGSFGPPEELPPMPGLDDLLSWPRAYAFGQGGLAVVFRDSQHRPNLTLSRDGRTFGPPQVVAGGRSAMPALGVFATGALAYVYQTDPPEGPGKISWVHMTEDGRNWSEAKRVSDTSPNVHDATLFRRGDGALDLYYCYTNHRYAGNFSVFRRRLGPGGRLGPEQRVTAQAAGSFIKPTLARLENGRLLLILTTTTRAPSDGGKHLYVTSLWEDAPWRERLDDNRTAHRRLDLESVLKGRKRRGNRLAR
jgi:hypothetical protein